MKVLFITSNRLGDGVLSTALADYIARSHPNVKFTVACGALVAPIFEGLPGRESTFILKKRKHHGHWRDLWRESIGTKWDLVVDLRDSAVSRLLFTRKAVRFGRHINKDCHKVEQIAQVMGLRDSPPAPCLWLTAAQNEAADHFISKGTGPVLGIGPTANWIGKIWPAERFAETIAALTAKDGKLAGARVAVFAAPGEEEIARQVLETVPKDSQIDVIAKAGTGEAAAILARCALYIGNDSGLMHCAAASGIPTLGLFGPTRDDWYRPWGDHAAFVRTKESFTELTGAPDFDVKKTGSLMGALETVDVIKAAERLLNSTQK